MRFFNGMKVFIGFFNKLVKLNSNIMKEIKIGHLKYKTIRIMSIIWKINRNFSKIAGKEHSNC